MAGKIPWDLIIAGVAGYYAYKRNLFGFADELAKLGIGGTPPKDTTPPGEEPPSTPGGLTKAQACEKARGPLAAAYDAWKTASCEDIASHVCGDRSLFVNKDPNSDDYKIRKAFGCPIP